MTNLVDNMKDYYGIGDIGFQMNVPPVENAQIGCKMNMINWADNMIQQLEQIKRTFRNAPVNSDEEHLRLMQCCWAKMIKAYAALDRVLDYAKEE